MANIRIIGGRSGAKRTIINNTGIKLYSGQTGLDAVVNYGLVGDKMKRFLKRYKQLNNIPIINKYVGLSKYLVVKRASQQGILVPESKLYLNKKDKISEWIEKRVHSSQGYGIRKARGRGEIVGKYYQRMISNRKYELRVHAFLWTPKENWVVNKRVGPADQVAWNFHQGGHFRSIHNQAHGVFNEARNVSEKILKMLNMSFGAVDFIVNNNLKVYFIEVNSSPGFTELNQNTYVNAMSKLKSLSAAKIKSFGRK